MDCYYYRKYEKDHNYHGTNATPALILRLQWARMIIESKHVMLASQNRET